jgi:hypothetical protein
MTATDSQIRQSGVVFDVEMLLVAVTGDIDLDEVRRF